MSTKIPWANETLNPFSGCTQIAAGCQNCYAKRLFPWVYGGRDFGDVQFHEERLEILKHWRKPRRIFIGSMGDLFHDKITSDQINKVFQAMLANDQHTYIILTKRPRRLWQWTSWMVEAYVHKAWPKHIQLGVSISTQKDANRLIPILLDIPAATRIVSIEPALEKINLNVPINRFETFHGVFMGCESGPGRRPFDMNWARDIRDQCIAWDVPFFFKQAPDENGKVVEMPELDGKVWDQLPEREIA